MFLDESGFYLLPGVVRTYAPRGQTPILRVPWTRDHFSVMGAITPEGKVFVHVLPHSVKDADIVRFLRHLLRHLSGKLLLLWDGLPAHRSNEVKRFLSEGAAQRVLLAPLPAYAPDLNPIEWVWHHLKHIELRNLCCDSLAQLKVELRKAKERLRHKTDLITNAFAAAGLAL